MSKGLIVVIRSLIGSLVCVVVGAVFASMTTNAGGVAVNQGTAHEALYGLCLSEGRAIAVGQGGLVLESLDGGETWNERNRFTDAALLDVDCGPRSQLYAGQGGAHLPLKAGGGNCHRSYLFFLECGVSAVSG